MKKEKIGKTEAKEEPKDPLNDLLVKIVLKNPYVVAWLSPTSSSI